MIVHLAARVWCVPVTSNVRRHMSAPVRSGIASFATTCLALVFLIQIPSGAGWLLTGSAFYAVAAVSGFIHGILFGRECATAVGWGTFLAGVVFSVPVVLVTYGLALAGLPLVIAFAALAGAGAYFGGQTFRSRGAV